ncbi:MAG: RNA polymerase sigma factor, partial [Pirellulaceae bacterium]
MKLSPSEANTLKHLVEQNSPNLALFARSRCDCPEDAVQEALLELVKQPQLPDEPIAWLYQAVRWRAISLARGDNRRRQRQQIAGRDSADSDERWFVETRLSDSQPALDGAELKEALHGLDETKRAIVVARIWGDQTFEQIAEAMELSRSGVHRRYQKAIAQLQELLSVSHPQTGET